MAWTTLLPLALGGLVMLAGLARYLQTLPSQTSRGRAVRLRAAILACALLSLVIDGVALAGPAAASVWSVPMVLGMVISTMIFVSQVLTDWTEVVLDAAMVAGCLVILGYEAVLVLTPVVLDWTMSVHVLHVLVTGWGVYTSWALADALGQAIGRARWLFVLFPASHCLAWTLLSLDYGTGLQVSRLLPISVVGCGYVAMGLFAALLAGRDQAMLAVRSSRPRSTFLPYVLCLVALVTTVVGLGKVDQLSRPMVYVTGCLCLLALITRQVLTLRGLQTVTDQVKARERHYRSLLTDSTDVIMICSRTGRLRYVSPAAANVLGPDVAVEGRPLGEALAVPASVFAEAVERLASEDGPVLVEGRRGHVVFEIALSTRGEELLASARDVTERDRLRQRLHFLAYHDPLTGLVNRGRVLSRISAMLAGGEECAVLFIDLDRFKQVNDTSGHQVGDQVLQQVAQRLRRTVREEDLLGRLGGDEFVAVVAAGRAVAADVATRVRRELTDPFEVEGRVYQLGASVGIALAGPGLMPEELLRRADLAMYEAKRQRRPWVVYQPVLARTAMAQATSDVLVSRALRERALQLHLQPLVDLGDGDGRVDTVEALLRWVDEAGQVRSPAEMLDFARRSGRMGEVTGWVLDSAVDVLARTPAQVRVAVNMPPELLVAPGLAAHLEVILASRDVAPSRLELEVTEDQLLEQAESSSSALLALRELGMRVVIDDFGTGFSSLGYLVDLPIDGLKIDRRFTEALPHSEAARSIVAGLVGIAGQLDLRVVAEGIETEQQHDWACRLGVHLGQGFWYARPEDSAGLADIHDLRSWATARSAEDPSRTRQSLPTLAAFRPWGSSAG